MSKTPILYISFLRPSHRLAMYTFFLILSLGSKQTNWSNVLSEIRTCNIQM